MFNKLLHFKYTGNITVHGMNGRDDTNFVTDGMNTRSLKIRVIQRPGVFLHFTNSVYTHTLIHVPSLTARQIY